MEQTQRDQLLMTTVLLPGHRRHLTQMGPKDTWESPDLRSPSLWAEPASGFLQSPRRLQCAAGPGTGMAEAPWGWQQSLQGTASKEK